MNKKMLFLIAILVVAMLVVSGCQNDNIAGEATSRGGPILSDSGGSNSGTGLDSSSDSLSPTGSEPGSSDNSGFGDDSGSPSSDSTPDTPDPGTPAPDTPDEIGCGAVLTSGVVLLKRDIIGCTDKITLTINKDNTILDCNKHAIRGSGLGISVEADDVVIKNCRISSSGKSGEGITFFNSDNGQIINNDISVITNAISITNGKDFEINGNMLNARSSSLYLDNTIDSMISENIIIATNWDAVKIGSKSENNIFKNNQYTSNKGKIFNDLSGSIYSNNLIFKNSNGELAFYGAKSLTIYGPGTIKVGSSSSSNSAITIAKNHISADTISYSDLKNKEAKLTFNNVKVSDTAFATKNDVECGVTCYGFEKLLGQRYSYYVSSLEKSVFSIGSKQETPEPSQDILQWITGYAPQNIKLEYGTGANLPIKAKVVVKTPEQYSITYNLKSLDETSTNPQNNLAGQAQYLPTTIGGSSASGSSSSTLYDLPSGLSINTQTGVITISDSLPVGTYEVRAIANAELKSVSAQKLSSFGNVRNLGGFAISTLFPESFNSDSDESTESLETIYRDIIITVTEEGAVVELTWTIEPKDVEAIAGEKFQYQVLAGGSPAIVYSLKEKLNSGLEETNNDFVIDSSGLIKSVSLLGIGTYNLEITASLPDLNQQEDVTSLPITGDMTVTVTEEGVSPTVELVWVNAPKDVKLYPKEDLKFDVTATIPKGTVISPYTITYSLNGVNNAEPEHSDDSLFRIDSNGLITNTKPLDKRTYELEVTATAKFDSDNIEGNNLPSIEIKGYMDVIVSTEHVQIVDLVWVEKYKPTNLIMSPGSQLEYEIAAELIDSSGKPILSEIIIDYSLTEEGKPEDINNFDLKKGDKGAIIVSNGDLPVGNYKIIITAEVNPKFLPEDMQAVEPLFADVTVTVKADDPGCNIVIDTPGIYSLSEDLVCDKGPVFVSRLIGGGIDCNGNSIELLEKGGVVIYAEGANFVMKNCIIEAPDSAGVVLYNVQGAKITDNKIGVGHYPIYLDKGTKNGLIENNILTTDSYLIGDVSGLNTENTIIYKNDYGSIEISSYDLTMPDGGTIGLNVGDSSSIFDDLVDVLVGLFEGDRNLPEGYKEGSGNSNSITITENLIDIGPQFTSLISKKAAILTFENFDLQKKGSYFANIGGEKCIKKCSKFKQIGRTTASFDVTTSPAYYSVGYEPNQEDLYWVIAPSNVGIIYGDLFSFTVQAEGPDDILYSLVEIGTGTPGDPENPRDVNFVMNSVTGEITDTGVPLAVDTYELAITAESASTGGLITETMFVDVVAGELHLVWSLPPIDALLEEGQIYSYQTRAVFSDAEANLMYEIEYSIEELGTGVPNDPENPRDVNFYIDSETGLIRSTNLAEGAYEVEVTATAIQSNDDENPEVRSVSPITSVFSVNVVPGSEELHWVNPPASVSINYGADFDFNVQATGPSDIVYSLVEYGNDDPNTPPIPLRDVHFTINEQTGDITNIVPLEAETTYNLIISADASAYTNPAHIEGNMAVTVGPDQGHSDCGMLIDTPQQSVILDHDITGCTQDDIITIKADGVTLDCQGNTLQGTGNNGVNIIDSDNVVVRNCNIVLNDGYNGILLDSATNSYVDDNKVTVQSQGINLEGGSYNTIRNNNILTTDDGMFLVYTSSNILLNNTIYVNDSSAITLIGSDSNQVLGNDVNARSTTALEIINSDNNFINGNELSASEYTIWFSSSAGNTLRNNELVATNNDIIFSVFEENEDLRAFNTLLYAKYNGHVRWDNELNIPESGVLSLENAIIITDNRIEVLSDLFPSLNSEAELLFSGIDFGIGNPVGTNPVPMRNGEPCGSYCSNFVIIDPTTYLFDVTGFTYYSIGLNSSEPTLYWDPVPEDQQVLVGEMFNYNVNAIFTGVDQDDIEEEDLDSYDLTALATGVEQVGVETNVSSNNEIIYELDANEIFVIDEATGLIESTKPLDISYVSYILSVTARDSVGEAQPITTSIIVSVIDKEHLGWIVPPMDYTILENNNFEHQVIAIGAESISYSLMEDPSGGVNSEFHFDIDSRTGRIFNILPLDEVESYSLTITADDAENIIAPLIGTMTVDVIDNTLVWSVFPQEDLTFYEGDDFEIQVLAVGSELITYDLVDDLSYFRIDQDTGLITNNGFIPEGVYLLTVSAIDGSGVVVDPLFGTLVIYILPYSIPELYWVEGYEPANQYLYEAQEVNYQVQAGGVDQIKYEVDDTTRFEVTDDGWITSIVPLNIGEYPLIVTAEDLEGVADPLVKGITVFVLELGDLIWRQGYSPEDGVIHEGEVFVLTVQAYGENVNDITYSIDDTINFETSMVEDVVVGSLFEISSLSTLTPGDYPFTVTARSEALNKELSADAILTVLPNGLEWVVLPKTPYELIYGEDLVEVFVQAGGQGDITYSFVTAPAEFEIDSVSGMIRNLEPLTNLYSNYAMTIMAETDASSANPFAPIDFDFEVDVIPYEMSWENLPFQENVEIGNYLSYVVDASGSTSISYELQPYTCDMPIDDAIDITVTAPQFSYDPITGLIKSVDTLDYHGITCYLPVTAHDEMGIAESIHSILIVYAYDPESTYWQLLPIDGTYTYADEISIPAEAINRYEETIYYGLSDNVNFVIETVEGESQISVVNNGLLNPGSYPLTVTATAGVVSVSADIVVDVVMTQTYNNDWSTNFSEVSDISAVTDLTLAIPNIGILLYPGVTDLTGINIDATVLIDDNLISVDSTNALALNATAILKLLELQLNNPNILRDDEVCSDAICTMINSYNNGELYFNVTMFTGYSGTDYCGNDHCDNGETTASCAQDCPSSGGGSPGSGSRRGGGGGPTPSCEPDWFCTSWTPAICGQSGRQSRGCSDINACGDTSEKPETSRYCQYVRTGDEAIDFQLETPPLTSVPSRTKIPALIQDTDLDTRSWLRIALYILLILIILGLIVLGVFFYFKWRKKKGKSGFKEWITNLYNSIFKKKHVSVSKKTKIVAQNNPENVQKIKQYLTNALANGNKLKAIRNKLISVGWNKKLVESVLKDFKKKEK